MKRSCLLSLALICGVALCGCSSVPAMPPELLAMKSECRPFQKNGVRRIALLELKNPTSSKEAPERIMGAFTAKLMDASRFELMERAQIDKVIQELKLDASGLVDAKSAKEAGRLLGADAVIVGEITNYQVEAKPFRYTYSRDKADLIPLPPGEHSQSIAGVPAETRSYTVEKYYVSVGFNLRMIAVDSGEIIWSRHLSRSFGMREGEYEIRNIYTLLDKIVDASVTDAVCEFRH